MKRTIAMVMLAGLIMTASCMAPKVPVYTHPVLPSKEAEKNAFRFIADHYRDPESVRIRNVKAYEVDHDGSIVWCAEVNGKNAYGAYVGYKQVYLRIDDTGTPVTALIQDDPSEGWKTATTACRNAASGETYIGGGLDPAILALFE